LLRSAIAVVGESGMRGLTHRAVDREAGMPEGTCSVYYRTRLALLTALGRFVATELHADVQALGASLPAPTGEEGIDFAISATTQMLLRWSEHPELIITMSELALEAARTSSLSEPIIAWRMNLTEVVESIVCRTEQPGSRLRAEAIVASLDGVVLSGLLATSKSDRPTYLRQMVTLVLRSIVDADLQEYGLSK
jgi:DNA-binding transcriptional regulator YbjK